MAARSFLNRSQMVALLIGWMAVSNMTYAHTIKFSSSLSSCAQISQGRLNTLDNLLLLKTKVTLHQPIGACGCMSTRAHYTSSVKNHGVKQILQEGLVVLKQSGELFLVLASEAMLSKGQTIQVEVGCAGPL